MTRVSGENTKLVPDDWIETEDGISQIHGVQDYFVEEFFTHEAPEASVGEYFTTKVVYKIFCNYEGKLRKTKFFSAADHVYCKPLDSGSLAILEDLKQKEVQAYDRFKARKPLKPVTSRVEFSLLIDPSSHDQVINEFNELVRGLRKPFTFAEFESAVRKDITGIMSPTFYGPKDTLRTNTLVSLAYDILRSADGKFAFTGGIAVPTYMNPDNY